MEICICAAMKMPDGYIVRGHRHNDCFRTIAGIPRYRSVQLDSLEQGFMTSNNRFVDREKAFDLQIKAGINSVDGEGYRANELYSEDLY